MIQRVIDNIHPSKPVHVILVLQNGLSLKGIGGLPMPDESTVVRTGPTQGAVDTILKAREHIDDSPLLIANCDQLADFDVDDFVSAEQGNILTFKSSKPHHSYVKKKDGIVTEIKEKEVISSEAVVGVYYFQNGSRFLSAADQVIADDKRVKGEFYVSSVIDQMIKDGYLFETTPCDCAILGTPEELQLFEMACRVAKS